MKKKLLSATGFLTLLGAVALAQTVSLTSVPFVNPNDLVQVLVRGVPTGQSKFANPGLITGTPGYVNEGAATTGNTYAYNNQITNIFMQPSGTLSAVTLTTSTNPGDGQRECFLSTQTTSSLTITVGTGQTSGTGIPTAGVANVPACWTYTASKATWNPSP